MENEILNTNLENQIYKKGHLQLAAFFGGPLTTVYIIAENYKQLGHPEKIKRTWIIGVVLCILFLVAVFFCYQQQIRHLISLYHSYAFW